MARGKLNSIASYPHVPYILSLVNKVRQIILSTARVKCTRMIVNDVLCDLLQNLTRSYLLSDCQTVSQYTDERNFIYTHKNVRFTQSRLQQNPQPLNDMNVLGEPLPNFTKIGE
jgi:hypothetical protein